MPNYAKLEEAYNRACGLIHTSLTHDGLLRYRVSGFEESMDELASDYREADSCIKALEAEEDAGQEVVEVFNIMGVIRKAAMSVVIRFLVGAGTRGGDEDALDRLHLAVRKLLQEFMTKEEAGRFVSFVDMFISGPLRDRTNHDRRKLIEATVMEVFEASLRDRTRRFEPLLTPEDCQAIANAGNDE